jgi:hypothetical protein
MPARDDGLGDTGIAPAATGESEGDAGAEATTTDAKLDLGPSMDLPMGDEECASSSIGATLGYKPVDVILVVDTSGSMGPVSASVEANLNVSLTQKLADSGLDYRVLALALYGDGAALCLAAPLGPDDCMPPGPLAPLGPLLFQYSAGLGSGSLLEFILSSYTTPPSGPNVALYGVLPSGWHEWVRPDALKVFLVITDAEEMSNATAPGDAFDANLLALDPAQFGTVDQRNYVLHTIAGLGQNNPASAPWPPDAPIVNTDCVGFSGKEPGQPLQQISVLTGGLRFPLCEYASFDALFVEIATGVSETVPVACDLAIPPPDGDGEIDPDTLVVTYTDALGVGHELHQVTALDQCESDAFWVEGPTIHLCPAACTEVQADDTAQLTVTYGCDVGYRPNG